jgi:hypothetical protein
VGSASLNLPLEDYSTSILPNDRALCLHLDDARYNVTSWRRLSLKSTYSGRRKQVSYPWGSSLHHAIHRSVTGHELCSGSTLVGGWRIPHKTIALYHPRGKYCFPKGVFGETRCQRLEDGQKVMVSVLPERQRVSEGAIDRGNLHRDDVYPCRKGGVMETFMSDFIVVSIL